MAKKILVIDDEELIIKSLAKLLEMNGFEAFVAKTGKDAIVMVGEENFDLIISDIRMPVMDGIEIIKNIRKHLEQNQRPSIPEILITGYANKEKYQNAIDLEVTAYINKPFDIKELLEIVKGVLNEG